MLSSIMTKPDFAEVMFLVAFILFVIDFILIALKNETIPHLLLMVAGLACIALGFLAL